MTITIPYIGPDSLESFLYSEEFPDWTVTAKTIVIIGKVVGMSLIHSAGCCYQNLQPSAILLNSMNHFPMILGIGPNKQEPVGRPSMLNRGSNMYAASELHRTGQVLAIVGVVSFASRLIIFCEGWSGYATPGADCLLIKDRRSPHGDSTRKWHDFL
jgi:hypothetical protein